MTTESGLLAAILANPADDLPRLVYADWLDENSQPEEAAFIRAQVAGVESKAEFAAYCARYHSEAPGLSHLLPHLNEAGGETVEYRRGFVHTLTCSLAVWMEVGPEVVRRHPVERVVLTDREQERYEMSGGRIVYAYRFNNGDSRPSAIPEALAAFFPPPSDYDITSHESLNSALSAALIAWAKSQLQPRIVTSPVSVDFVAG